MRKILRRGRGQDSSLHKSDSLALSSFSSSSSSSTSSSFFLLQRPGAPRPCLHRPHTRCYPVFQLVCSCIFSIVAVFSLSFFYTFFSALAFIIIICYFLNDCSLLIVMYIKMFQVFFFFILRLRCFRL